MKIIISIFILLFSFFTTNAGEKNKTASDSLKQLLSVAKDDQTKFYVLEELTKQYVKENPNVALEYLKNSTVLAKKINDSSNFASLEFVKGIYLDGTNNRDSALKTYSSAAELLKKYNKTNDLEKCYSLIAMIYLDKGSYQQSIVWFTRSTEVARILKDEDLESKNLMYCGMAYNQMGNHPKGLIFLQDALRIAKKNNDKKRISQVLLFIGSAYSETPDQDYAMNYFKQCQDIALQLKDSVILLDADMYIANNHYYNKRYQKAIEIYEQALIISKQQHNKRVYAGALGNLGNVYADMGDNKKALDYQFEAIKVFEEENDNQGLTICYSAIGASYSALKQYPKAIEFYQKGLAIAQEMNSWEDLIEIHLGLSRVYEVTKDYKKAYENFKSYQQFNDSVFNEGNTKKLTELELNYRFEAQQKEQELVQKNKEILADEKLKRQKLLSYSSIVGVIFLLLLVGVVVRSNTQRKKTNEQLQLSNAEIVMQKDELQKKSTIIEMAYNDIKSSINYAKRIQEAILPVKTEIKKSFPESFVLFKPRDVVSGDFYWFANRNNKNIIACVDCTGHGVPGAFMSMIGNTLLNEIVNEKGIETPSDILNLLHIRVRQSLKQNLESTETRDGMDIAICTIDTINGILQYAGANRPLYLIRNNKLEEIKSDKMSIGGDQIELDRNFKNHRTEIKKQDVIYMSSDGYADQFGGEKGKKFMVKRFHQTLMEIQNATMEQQGIALKKTIENWQGKLEQVDDILVIGIKI